MVGWIMVFPLYLIFIRFKIQNSERRIIYDMVYIFIYVLFILVMIIVGLSEKLRASDSTSFFKISAWILGGIISPICSCIVWIPQIIKLIRTRRQGNLSLAMFIMQTPGNAVIIVFQILYNQSFTTWGTYVVCLIEQATIVIILIIYKCRDRNNTGMIDIESGINDNFDRDFDDLVSSDDEISHVIDVDDIDKI